MTYRLLALDLDGTLLRSDGTIDERDVAAVAELRASGVAVTIVTGRMRSGSVAAARACGIAGAIACVEGSHLTEVDSGLTLVHHPMPRDLTALLRGTFRSAGLASFVFDAEVIHHDLLGEPYTGYISVWSPNLRVVEDEQAWSCDALAAVAIGGRDAVVAAHEALRADQRLYSASFEVRAYPDRHAVLVRAAGPTKGTALAELCRSVGCGPGEAVAVGDWFNDLPMFAVAGRSFAMGSTPESVRAAATDQLVAEAGAGGGIAEAIRRAWG